MRKVGSDTPSSDPASSSCDSMLLRLSAVYTPSGTPTTSASTAATSDSSSVAGRRDLSKVETGSLWRREMPKLPCAALATKWPNWTTAGSFRPRRSRSSMRSASVASWPSMMVTGSPTY